MRLLDDLAESRIREALERGEFDDLPNAGTAVAIDDDSSIPPEWRMAYRVLRNAGYLPQEVALRKEAAALEALVAELAKPDERDRALRRLETLRLALAMDGRERSMWLDDADYRERVIGKLRARNG